MIPKPVKLAVKINHNQGPMGGAAQQAGAQVLSSECGFFLYHSTLKLGPCYGLGLKCPLKGLCWRLGS